MAVAGERFSFKPREWSISARLAVAYGLTLLAVLSVFSGVTYGLLNARRHADFDRHLNHEHRVLMPLITFVDGKPAFENLENLRSVAYQTDGVFGTYVRLIEPTGAILYQSPNFDQHSSLASAIPQESVPAQISRSWEGEHVRSHYLPLEFEDRLVGWLEVTGYEWSLRQEMLRLQQTFAIGILISLFLAIGGGYLLARRALEPVSRIVAAANTMEPSDLTARLPTEFGVKDELSDLAETINHLLGRLEESFLRERRFSSYAAHELVTPLAVMRGELELALRSATTESAAAGSAAGAGGTNSATAGMSAALEEIDRMNGIIRSLRELSKAERLRDLPQERIDLGALCQLHADRFSDRAEVHDVTIHRAIEPSVFVLGEPVALGKVIDNLIDNALKYSPDGSEITVDVRGEDAHAFLEVSDRGYGFEPQEKERLFDRFFRSDYREVQDQPGSGLGLSVVRAVVHAFGGTVAAFSDGKGLGSRFVVRLPRIG